MYAAGGLDLQGGVSLRYLDMKGKVRARPGEGQCGSRLTGVRVWQGNMHES